MVRFAEAEYEVIAARAASAGVSVQRFLAGAALAGPRPVPVPPAVAGELAALRRLTASLGNNVSQIARALKSGARPDASATAAAGAVRRVMRRIDAALAYPGIPARRNDSAAAERSADYPGKTGTGPAPPRRGPG